VTWCFNLRHVALQRSPRRSVQAPQEGDKVRFDEDPGLANLGCRNLAGFRPTTQLLRMKTEKLRRLFDVESAHD
jgi:hypothetical protein